MITSVFFTTLITGIVVFLVFLLLLILLILVAKAKFIPQGLVKVKVNGERVLEVAGGNTLLTTLGNNKLFLPSACGGGGTCSMCKCQVVSGGGGILETEKPYFTRKEIQNNWRLGCQVKVKEDMEIQIPDEIFGIKKWECEVISNKNVATFIKELVIKLPKGENLDFKSGGYVQIDVPRGEFKFSEFDIPEEYKQDYDGFGMWDLVTKNDDDDVFRAYSMANHPAEGNIMKFNIRIASPPWDKARNKFMDVNPGLCSSYVFSLKPGDKITVSGPFGEFFIKENSEKEMIYIGGGAGMAPLRSHVFHLFKTMKTTNRKVSYWYGGRSLRELFYTEEFREIEKEFPNFKYNIALSEPVPEDNWDGYVGFIHQVVLENYLKDHPEPEEIEYYLCGPPMMLAAIQSMLDNLGVPQENIAFDEF